MTDTVRERLARAAESALLDTGDKSPGEAAADAILAELDSMGYTLTKRIPHGGKVE